MVNKHILLLGSGELGKEFCISAKRLGATVTACDNYANAPAMQVSDASYVLDMLDGDKLKRLIGKVQPDLIVPEIEAIRTEVLLEQEADGNTVIPTARAVNLTMNRDRIRDRAAELGLRTARYAYASSEQELLNEISKIGLPCVVKPVMSSSGKGQSIITSTSEVANAWEYAVTGMRGDRISVIVEEFIEFDYEITLLTIRTAQQGTLFCPSIGHVQQEGDYRYSWQPAHIMNKGSVSTTEIRAQEMANIITNDLGGVGVFGVEFFICKGEPIFSELSPRPHDTGMVTMFTQNLSEFDLHARAVLELPIPEISLLRHGASHVLLAAEDSTQFHFEGIEQALSIPGVDLRIFGKPITRPNRRMGVILAPSVQIATKAANCIRVVSDLSS